MTPRDRLLSLALDTDIAEALMAGQRERFEKLRTRHLDGTAPRAVSSNCLFQTPEGIAARMAALLAGHMGTATTGRILEPSAGLGRLYRAGRAAMPGAAWVLVDSSPDCMRELYRETDWTGREAHGSALLIQDDFLERDAESLGGPFDGVLMNPPFDRGRDVRHILHASGMLKPGALLVGLCYGGLTQEKRLRPLVDTWEPLPANSFRESGTGAGVVMVTIRKQ